MTTDTLRQRPGDQPLPEGGRECVQDRLIQEIEARKQLGVARYGSPLMTHNGRNSIQDAWEEAIDLAVYLTQARMEQDDRAALQAAAVTDAALPHGDFTLRVGRGLHQPHNVEVMCSCGRGYGFADRVDSRSLLTWLADHDTDPANPALTAPGDNGADTAAADRA